MIAFLGWILWSVIWGVATKKLNNEKGYSGGFWWGFFFGFVGLIVILVKPDKRTMTYENTALSNLSRAYEEEKRQTVLAKGEWRCFSCGSVNASYTGTCGCGMTKDKNISHSHVASEKFEVPVEKDSEIVNINKIKSYKELLDAGIISQEEFEDKKKELLR